METKKILTKTALKAKQRMSREHAAYLELKLNRYIEETPENTVEYDHTSPELHGHKNLKDLRTLVANLILEEFSLSDLYIVFFCADDGFNTFEPTSISESIKYTIDNLNYFTSSGSQNRKRLVKKVKEMSPIEFGLISLAVFEADIFWNEEKGDVIYLNEIKECLKRDVAYSL